MTALQKQCLLTYFGFDCGGVDGIWGEKSAGATAEFQRQQGLIPDGIFGPDTEAAILARFEKPEDGWKGIRYFSPREMACKCGRCGGFPAEPDRRLLLLADRVRGHFGGPAVVSSGVRCPDHNTAVGGVANSRHLRGKAMDFAIPGRDSQEILCYVNQQPETRYAYAIDQNYIHMDVE